MKHFIVLLTMILLSASPASADVYYVWGEGGNTFELTLPDEGANTLHHDHGGTTTTYTVEPGGVLINEDGEAAGTLEVDGEGGAEITIGENEYTPVLVAFGERKQKKKKKSDDDDPEESEQAL